MGYESLSNPEAVVQQDFELKEIADAENPTAKSEISEDEIGGGDRGLALPGGNADDAEGEMADEGRVEFHV